MKHGESIIDTSRHVQKRHACRYALEFMQSLHCIFKWGFPVYTDFPVCCKFYTFSVARKVSPTFALVTHNFPGYFCTTLKLG